MILKQVESGSEAATVHSTKCRPHGSTKVNGREWLQKGDFNGQMNFVIGSLTWKMNCGFYT